MPKVMMPVEIEVRPIGSKWDATAWIGGNEVWGDVFTLTQAEALAAAKEWVLENGGTWEEEESTGNQEGE